MAQGKSRSTAGLKRAKISEIASLVERVTQKLGFETDMHQSDVIATLERRCRELEDDNVKLAELEITAKKESAALLEKVTWWRVQCETALAKRDEVLPTVLSCPRCLMRSLNPVLAQSMDEAMAASAVSWRQKAEEADRLRTDAEKHVQKLHARLDAIREILSQ